MVVDPATPSAYQGLQQRVSPDAAKKRFMQLQAFVQAAMVKGVDYGVLFEKKGDKEEKQVLFQPGAQKLCELYGLTWKFTWREAVKDWDKGFFYFEAECVLSDNATGAWVGNGIGSCNSREDRYAYRWEYLDRVPKGVSTGGLKTKNGRDGKPFMVRMPNEDIYSLVNTLEKMACKRALVHAVLGATRSSGLFAQDIEDMSDDFFTEIDVTTKTEVATKTKAVVILEEMLAKAFTDEECKAVGRHTMGAEAIQSITAAERAELTKQIAARRKEIKDGKIVSPPKSEEKAEAAAPVAPAAPASEPKTAYNPSEQDAPPPEE
jgi:hypothetical protein